MPVPVKEMPIVTLPLGKEYESKSIPIGYVPPGMDIKLDDEGLPTVIEEVVGKKYGMLGEIIDKFTQKGWLPWMLIPFPGVSTSFLVFIREKE